MKTKELIQYLSKLNPDERIMVAYWTRETVQDWFSDDQIITDEIWNSAVDEFDSYSLQDTADDITDFILSEFPSIEVNV